jgi:hypothetical protein
MAATLDGKSVGWLLDADLFDAGDDLFVCHQKSPFGANLFRGTSN